MNAYQALRKGFSFHRIHWYLVGIVTVWVLATHFLVKHLSQEDLIFFFFLAIIAENWLTASVYSSIVQEFRNETVTPKRFLQSGGRVFIPFLAVKMILLLCLLAIIGLAAVVTFSFASLPPVFSGVLTFLYLCWLAFPCYCLLFLLFAPLLIFLEKEISVRRALRKSVLFTREHFSELVVIGGLFGILMVFVNLFGWVYTISNPFLEIAKAIILGIGEIGFVASLCIFYFDNGERV